MKPKFLIPLVVLAVIAVLAAGYFFTPRYIVINPEHGTAEGLRVSLIERDSAAASGNNEPQIAWTDNEGIARFGNGPWAYHWGGQGWISVEVTRGDRILLDKVIERPRSGILELTVP